MPARRLWVALCLIVLLAALAVWIVQAFTGDAGRAWRAMLINFQFFTALACGMVAWPAVVLAAQGKWSRSLEPVATSAAAFAPVSIVAFIALFVGREHWAAWITTRMDFQHVWLNVPFVFARDAIALAGLWILAIVFARQCRSQQPSRVLAGWLVFAYCAAFALLGFDMVMALDPKWYSALFGGYFFVSGFYIALAGWGLAAVLCCRGVERDRLHDLGKLIVAFSLLTAYMMYSQLLPIWYENMPEETRQIFPRLRQGKWAAFSWLLLALIYLGPLVILLTRWAKRTPAFLGIVCLALLAGMWIERWWLVAPTVGATAAIGLTEISLTVAFASALVLAMNFRLTCERAHNVPKDAGAL